MSTITERIMRPGSFAIEFADLPLDLLTGITTFGHVVVTMGRVDPRELGDSGMLAAARYSGVVTQVPSTDTEKQVVRGAGMWWWLQDGEGKGEGIEDTPVVITAKTMANAIRDVLPGSVTEGTLGAPAGTYTGEHSFEAKGRAVKYIAQTFSDGGDGYYEVRVNPDGSLDADTIANLYGVTPTAIVVRENAGADPTLDAVPVNKLVGFQDATRYTTRVVLVGEGLGTAQVNAAADITPATPYYDITGSLVKKTRFVQETMTEATNATARVALALAEFDHLGEDINLATGYDVEGTLGIGERIYLFDPPRYADIANEAQFRGQHLNPVIVRIVSLTWPLLEGMGVYFRPATAAPTGDDYLDLTEWVHFHTDVKSTQLEVGDASATLAGTFVSAGDGGDLAGNDLIDPGDIQDGDVVATLVVNGGSVSSSDYVAGVSGWTINGDGSAEFNNLTMRGDVVSINWDGDASPNFTFGPNNWAEFDGTSDVATSDRTAAYSSDGHVEVALRMTDYTPTGDATLVGQWGSAEANRSHRVGMNVAGKMVVEIAEAVQFLELDGVDDEALSDKTTAYTGDGHFETELRATDWTPASDMTLGGQWGSAGTTRTHLVLLDTTSDLVLLFREKYQYIEFDGAGDSIWADKNGAYAGDGHFETRIRLADYTPPANGQTFGGQWGSTAAVRSHRAGFTAGGFMELDINEVTGQHMLLDGTDDSVKMLTDYDPAITTDFEIEVACRPSGAATEALASIVDKDSEIDASEAYAFAANYSGSGNWLDESGNAHHGVITNAPWYDWNTTDGNYFRLPGDPNNDQAIYAPLDGTKFLICNDGDLDARILCSLDDWTPLEDAYLYHNSNSATFITGWGAFVRTDGKIEFWIGDGAKRAAVSSVATSFTNGTKQGVRVTYDSSAGLANFYTMDDPDDVLGLATTSWTLLGTANVSTGGTTCSTNTYHLAVGFAPLDAAVQMVGNVYKVYVKDDSTVVADMEASDFGEADIVADTYTDNAPSANTWVRLTSADDEIVRLVVHAHFWMNGTDAHIEAPDHANLDFAAGESLTFGVAFRSYDVTPAAYQSIAGKRVTTTEGYALNLRDTGSTVFFVIEDTGGLGPNDDTPALTDRKAHTVVGVRNTTDDDVEAFADGVGSGTPSTDTTTATLANTAGLRLGAESDGTNRFQGELWAYSLIRSALSDPAVARLSTELKNQTVGQTGFSLDFYVKADDKLEGVLTDHSDGDATTTFLSTAAVSPLTGTQDWAFKLIWDGSTDVEFWAVDITSDPTDTTPTYVKVGASITTGIENFTASLVNLFLGTDKDDLNDLNGRLHWAIFRKGLAPGTVFANPNFTDAVEWPDSSPNADAAGRTWTPQNNATTTKVYGVTTFTSSVTLGSALSLTDDLTDVYLKYTWDIDDGASDAAIKFWYRTTGWGAWTQLGATQTNGAVLVPNSCTQAWILGADLEDGTRELDGRMYHATWKDAIDGTDVANPQFHDWATEWSDNGPNIDAAGVTWTLTNAVRTVITTGLSAQSDATLASATTLVDDDTDLFVKVTWDIDNGANGCDVKFYWKLLASDSWTQLGTTITIVGLLSEDGTLSINDGTEAWKLGEDGATTGIDYDGRMYSATWKDAIDGTDVANPNFRSGTEWPNSNPNADAAGVTWTLTGSIITLGSENTEIESTVTLTSEVAGLTDNVTDIELKYTWDIDNGASGSDFKFYWRTDRDAAWDQLGTTVTHGAVLDPRDPVQVWTVGGDGELAARDFDGRIYEVLWRNAIDSAQLLANPQFNQWEPGDTSGFDVQGNAWTFTGAIVAGASEGYFIQGATGFAQFKDIYGKIDIFTALEKRTMEGVLIAESEYAASVAVTGSWADVVSQTFTLPYTGEVVDMRLEASAFLSDLGENEELELRVVVVDDSGTNTGVAIGAAENPNATGSSTSIAHGHSTHGHGDSFAGASHDVSGTSGIAGHHSDFHFSGTYTGASHTVTGSVSSNSVPSGGGTPTITVSLADVSVTVTVMELFAGMTAAGTSVTVKLQAKGINYVGSPAFRLYARAKRQFI